MRIKYNEIKKVSVKIAKERLVVCGECEKLVNNRRCGLCDCLVEVMVWREGARCGVGK